MPDSHPKDNLVRAWASSDAVGLRAGTNDYRSTADGNTMHGYFAVFDQWTEIHSHFEGDFLERIAPGAFRDTFKERGDQIRVLYDHGADPMIGNKPLGSPDVLREDKKGAYYEVSLFDSSYVNDLKPAIRSGQLGASFRFQVTGEEWTTPSKGSPHNPAMLDERTITAAKVYEFGPVTFPAYDGASVGLRSRTDEFIEHFLNDPLFVQRFKDRTGPAVVEQIRLTLPTTAAASTATTIVSNIKAFGARNTLPTAEGTPEAPTAPAEPEPPTEPEAEIPDETADGGEADTRERRLAYLQRSMAGFEAHLSRLERSP